MDGVGTDHLQRTKRPLPVLSCAPKVKSGLVGRARCLGTTQTMALQRFTSLANERSTD
jgi:hypothetical protein